jgi:uncharacterized membrane protein
MQAGVARSCPIVTGPTPPSRGWRVPNVTGGTVPPGITPPVRLSIDSERRATQRAREGEVSDLVAITFDQREQAGQALKALRQVEGRGLIHLTETAVIEKDAEGHVHTKNEADSGVEVGVMVTGTLGLLVAIAFPIAGITAGLAGGAWAGSKMRLGVDKDFLERLRDDVRPGTSALLLMVSDVKPRGVPAIREAMQPFRGTVYETKLSPEAQRTLHEVVEGWQNAPTT